MREKRNQDREAWARKLRDASDARIKAREDSYGNARKIKEEKVKYEEMVEQFYQELRDMNPEWVARRQKVLEVRGSSTFMMLSRSTTQRKAMGDKTRPCR